jgi:predicted translin family RNA/ssDNA-binding protein
MESNRLANLVSWLSISAAGSLDPHVGQAADAIELLQRELKCSKEMWEQQQELALEYLADIEKANERIAELEQEIDDYETIYEGSVVETQARRIAELEAALKPFADEAQFFVSKALDNHLAAPDRLYLTIGQFRAARKVLEGK